MQCSACVMMMMKYDFLLPFQGWLVGSRLDSIHSHGREITIVIRNISIPTEKLDRTSNPVFKTLSYNLSVFCNL